MDFDFCCMESYDNEQNSWPGTSPTDTNLTNASVALHIATLSVEHADVHHSMSVMLDQERPGEVLGQEDREILGFCVQAGQELRYSIATVARACDLYRTFWAQPSNRVLPHSAPSAYAHRVTAVACLLTASKLDEVMIHGVSRLLALTPPSWALGQAAAQAVRSAEVLMMGRLGWNFGGPNAGRFLEAMLQLWEGVGPAESTAARSAVRAMQAALTAPEITCGRLPSRVALACVLMGARESLGAFGGIAAVQRMMGDNMDGSDMAEAVRLADLIESDMADRGLGLDASQPGLVGHCDAAAAAAARYAVATPGLSPSGSLSGSTATAAAAAAEPAAAAPSVTPVATAATATATATVAIPHHVRAGGPSLKRQLVVPVPGDDSGEGGRMSDSPGSLVCERLVKRAMFGSQESVSTMIDEHFALG